MLKEHGPVITGIVIAAGIVIGLAFTILSFTAGFGELRSDVAHLDEGVTRLESRVEDLESSVNDLDSSVEALRLELIKAISDSTAETVRMVNGHRHGEMGEVYIQSR